MTILNCWLGEVWTSSTEDEIRITAKKKIILNCGSNHITLDPYQVKVGSTGELEIESPHLDYIQAPGRLKIPLAALAEPLGDEPNRLALGFFDTVAQPMAGVPYTLTFDNGLVLQGQLDEQGHALHSPVPDSPARVQYQLPEPLPDKPWPSHDVLQAALNSENVGPALRKSSETSTSSSFEAGARDLP